MAEMNQTEVQNENTDMQNDAAGAGKGSFFSRMLTEAKRLGIARWIMIVFSLITFGVGVYKLVSNLKELITSLGIKYGDISTQNEYYLYMNRTSVENLTPLFWALITVLIGILGIRALKSLAIAKVLHIVLVVQFALYFSEMMLMYSMFKVLTIFLKQTLFYAAFIVVVILVKKRLRREMMLEDEGRNAGTLVKKGFRDIDDIIMWSISVLLIMFTVVVIFISSKISATSIQDEYLNSANNLCRTVLTIVGDDAFDLRWEGGDEEDAELNTFRSLLSEYCDAMGVDAIHLLVCDKPDGGASLLFSSYSQSRLDSLMSEEVFLEPDAEEYQQSYRVMYRTGIPYESIKHKNGDHPYISQLLAVRGEDDKLKGIIVVELLSTRLQLSSKFFMYSIGMAAAILIIITVLVSSRFLNRDIAKPLRKISHEAKRFAGSKDDIHVGEKLKEISSRVNEIDRLNSSIIEMESDTIKYMSDLAHATKERERINTELSLATSIQADSLPNVFPAFPDRKDFDIHASMRPAKEVGGDFYDFFLIDDDHIALVMADVSGKGVPAALFMMITKLLIDVQADGKLSPGEVLSLVSDRISKNNKEDMFVTVWLGILEFSTGKLISTNAGHEDPIIYTPGEGFKLEKEKHGVPVGIMEGYPFQNLERTIPHGSKIFLYTDGVPEAVNLSDEMFGVERLEEVLNASADKKPDEITTAVVAAVDEFAGEAVQFDDITTLCFEWF